MRNFPIALAHTAQVVRNIALFPPFWIVNVRVKMNTIYIDMRRVVASQANLTPQVKPQLASVKTLALATTNLVGHVPQR